MDSNVARLIEKMTIYEKTLIEIGLLLQDKELFENQVKELPMLNSKLKLIEKLSKVVINANDNYLNSVRNDMWFVDDKNIKLNKTFRVLDYLKKGVL